MTEPKRLESAQFFGQISIAPQWRIMNTAVDAMLIVSDDAGEHVYLGPDPFKTSVKEYGLFLNGIIELMKVPDIWLRMKP